MTAQLSTIWNALRCLPARVGLRRSISLLTLLAFTASLCGLPVSEYQPSLQPESTAAAVNHAKPAKAATCGCSSSLIAAGRCCCSKGATSNPGTRSCCKRPRPTVTASHKSEQKDDARIVWLGCNCGSSSPTAWLAVGAEPRLLNSTTDLIDSPTLDGAVQAAALALPVRSDDPDTPPPRLLVG